ncbi:hypothetical protein RD792_016419 [Penstemon davidsonii]|uniref:Dirigent protein n=1 Tax=Penstemon davidsonii TaxID=160366 RepID=A0ABR0CKG5_9LAMI|nr:hypothetical protein RD792_016419 [Penstemon davidsonii]
MAKLYSNLLPIFIFLVSPISWAPIIKAQNSDQPTWARRVETKTEVITTLQFYFHDILSGQKPSAVRIAQATQTNNSSTIFGMLMMIDDPLTIGPDPSSKVVGWARGMYGSAGQTDFGLIMALSYGFTDGIYDGSSFSLLGINKATQPFREMPIVGGTGLFRFARGYAVAHTYQLDLATGDAVVGVLDDLLTAEPDINSQEIGRVQGLITSADLKTSGLAMNLNFVFTAGEYKGSTISILGRNQIDDEHRELPVVGGTGIFRMARGYAITNTYSYDAVTNYGVLEYTLYVTYVEDAANIFLANE